MDISLSAQREIEARLASALIGGYAEALGPQEALAIAEGLNPDIRLERTQTIMQGAAFCDFHFYLAV